jgi:carbon-monoxide dehydrogenase medium subunit
MKKFILLEPQTLDEAFTMLAKHKDANTFILAGATDLIPQLRSGAVSADYLVDITRLGLNTITETEDRIIIGSTCTLKEVLGNPAVTKYLPALAEACNSVGAIQTRGLATIGGNSCSAVPSLDSAPPLFVYNADYILTGANNPRVVNVRDFFLAPRQTAIVKNEEILTAISVPKPSADFTARFTKFGRRAALSLSIVNCCVGCRQADGKMYAVSCCIGACAATPVRIPAAEEYLEGKGLGDICFEKLQEHVKAGILPISDIRASAEYRLDLAAALVCKQVRNILGSE